MFKVENTGMPSWKRILDNEGNYVASLDETYNGDWAITSKDSFDYLTDTTFSNATKASNWLWKHREILGEPYSSMEEVQKKTKRLDKIVEEPIIEVNENDLFGTFKELK